MEKDRSTTEKLGVDYVDHRLRRDNTLHPNISYNDKTLSWDGYILVFDSVPFSAEKLRAKIPTQVKTITVKRYTKTRTISVAHLKNYKRDGSILYFSVQIINDDEYKIFYADLFLIDLERLIATAKNKSVSVSFKELPKDAQEIKQIINQYIDTSSKQRQLLPDVYDLETFAAKYPRGEVTFNLNLPAHFNQQEVLSSINSQKPYLYSQQNGLLFPVGRLDAKFSQLFTRDNVEIKVNDEILFTQITKRISEDKQEILIGNSIILSRYDKTVHIEYKFKKGELTATINDLLLIDAIIENKPIFFNGTQLFSKFEKTKQTDASFVKNLLKFYSDVQILFNKLGIRKQLYLDKLTDKEEQNLFMLCQSELYGKEVPLGHPDSFIAFLHISDINILCHCQPSNKQGYYYLNEIFHDGILQLYLPENKVPVSSYLYLIEAGLEGFRCIDNINYEKMIDSLRKYEVSPPISTAYIDLLLIMLKYYDETKYSKVIVACFELTKLLFKTNDTEINFINLCQVKYRMDCLSFEDKNRLVNIKNNTKADTIKLACSILLESVVESEVYYNQLDEIVKANFDNYPIVNIWKSFRKQ